jgi:hypothetical protein
MSNNVGFATCMCVGSPRIEIVGPHQDRVRQVPKPKLARFEGIKDEKNAPASSSWRVQAVFARTTRLIDGSAVLHSFMRNRQACHRMPPRDESTHNARTWFCGTSATRFRVNFARLVASAAASGVSPSRSASRATSLHIRRSGSQTDGTSAPMRELPYAHEKPRRDGGEMEGCTADHDRSLARGTTHPAPWRSIAPRRASRTERVRRIWPHYGSGLPWYESPVPKEPPNAMRRETGKVGLREQVEDTGTGRKHEFPSRRRVSLCRTFYGLRHHREQWAQPSRR